MAKTILPPTSTDLEKALDVRAATYFDGESIVDKLWSPTLCPLDFLPFLAWSLSVDDWDEDWPEATKRNVIAASVFVHRHKGTAGALKKALEALDLGVTISEWFEHGGDPFTFRADVNLQDRGLSEKEIRTIYSAIDNTKNARSHLERLRAVLSPGPANLLIGMYVMTGQIATISPFEEAA
jgi:phage tail P2-like protein